MQTYKKAFERAIEWSISDAVGGIGTLSERRLHRTLKYYIDNNCEHHEVEYLGSVVDILNENGVTEIQTRSLERLNPKLEKLLPTTPVTVVYPVAVERTMSWLDESTGELTAPRRVSRKGRASDALIELYRIGEHLGNSNLTLQI